MQAPQQSSNARIAAVLALAAAFVILVVVLFTSLGGSGSEVGRQTSGKVHRTPSGGQPHKVYVVKPGDCCLSQIAQKTGVSLVTLEKLNPGLDPQAIHSGDRVKLR